jgi:hypothetical protein
MSGPSADAPALDERGRRAVAETWRYRARAEREAQSRFTRLAERLEAVGASAPVLALARKAPRDERRHARLCAFVAARYGLPAPERTALPAPEIAPASLALRERVLYEVVAFCCVAESLNAALLSVTVERARATLVREAARRLLRDEVDHARLGWAHLTAERRAGLGGFLAGWLPAMLRDSVEPELFLPEPPEPQAAALEAHGNLPRATRRALLRAGLCDVLLPGLEQAGVDTAPARAWLARVPAD